VFFRTAKLAVQLKSPEKRVEYDPGSVTIYMIALMATSNFCNFYTKVASANRSYANGDTVYKDNKVSALGDASLIVTIIVFVVEFILLLYSQITLHKTLKPPVASRANKLMMWSLGATLILNTVSNVLDTLIGMSNHSLVARYLEIFVGLALTGAISYIFYTFNKAIETP